jgi:hypothetical protein
MFFPFAENGNIAVIYSFDDLTSTEYTFLPPFYAKTEPVDGHI